jgi:hypothetical protein
VSDCGPNFHDRAFTYRTSIIPKGTYTSYYNTAVEPAGILLPMTIVVLISVVKDGIEDVK